MAVFYDTHAHLTDPRFSQDLPEVIARAASAGISRIVTIGTDLESSRQAIGIAERFPNVLAAVGWHPSDADKAPDDWGTQLKELARHPRVVAIGEIGLDYYWLPSRNGGTAADDQLAKAKQAILFRQQLEVCADMKLNCIIHQRDCMEPILSQFAPFSKSVRAVFHCFSGDNNALRRIVEMGSIVSYTGIVTFKNGQNVRDALVATPFGQFMLETDSPYLAPLPYRGRRCEPAFVKETAEFAAQVKGCSLDELSRATCDTASSFFKGLL